MLDVIATTIAAIYEIFGICCVACSYDQWLKGIDSKSEEMICCQMYLGGMVFQNDKEEWQNKHFFWHKQL